MMPFSDFPRELAAFVFAMEIFTRKTTFKSEDELRVKSSEKIAKIASDVDSN
jgi:hypothetical protein